MDPETLEALRRNSGLALTKEGSWTWGTGVVENPRVQAMFHQGVAVRADGEVTLSVGRMWAYVATEGPAFFVSGLRCGDDVAGPTVELLGARALPIFGHAPPVAGWGPDQRIYLWLHGLAGPAICLRSAHQAFAALLDEGPAGLAFVFRRPAQPGSGQRADDRRVPVVMLSEIPAAAAPRPA